MHRQRRLGDGVGHGRVQHAVREGQVPAVAGGREHRGDGVLGNAHGLVGVEGLRGRRADVAQLDLEARRREPVVALLPPPDLLGRQVDGRHRKGTHQFGSFSSVPASSRSAAPTRGRPGRSRPSVAARSTNWPGQPLPEHADHVGLGQRVVVGVADRVGDFAGQRRAVVERDGHAGRALVREARGEVGGLDDAHAGSPGIARRRHKAGSPAPPRRSARRSPPRTASRTSPKAGSTSPHRTTRRPGRGSPPGCA